MDKAADFRLITLLETKASADTTLIFYVNQKASYFVQQLLIASTWLAGSEKRFAKTNWDISLNFKLDTWFMTYARKRVKWIKKR